MTAGLDSSGSQTLGHGDADRLGGLLVGIRELRRIAAGSSWWQPALAFLVALAAAQRFTAPYVSAYACLLPVALALLFWGSPSLRNAFIAMALVAKVDSSEVAYENTLNALRFLIYAMAVAAVFDRFSIQPRRLLAYLCYVLILLLVTLSNHASIDTYSVVRDGITLLLLLAVLGERSVRTEPGLLIRMLVAFSLGLMLGELINIAYFYPDGSLYYLSYDSLKCVVVLASLYAMVKGRVFVFAALFVGSVIVLTAYATRMLFLTYLVCIVILLFGAGVSIRGKIAAVAIFMLGIFGLVAVVTTETLESSRVFSIIYSLAESGDLLDYIRLLDPVRFVEHEFFFDRPALQLVFGSGLGSGFIDTTGAFSFIPYGSGAFSDLELLEGRYFRLHDAWIYFGLRLGLVFVVLAYGYFCRAMLSASGARALLGAFGLLVINTATFSLAGLFMAALIAAQLRARDGGVND